MKQPISYAIALLLNLVSADQPVHCLRESFFGEWMFKVSTDKQVVNLFDTQQICSHTVPNSVQLINKDHQFNFGASDSYKVNILEGFKVEAVLCKNGQTCDNQIIKGKWSMIYDQAMNVELETGQRFISNFRYEIKNDIAKDPVAEASKNGILKFATIETGDYDKFDSECNGSMVGFVQNIPDVTGVQQTMSQHGATCFFAERLKNYKYEETKEVNTEKMKTNRIIAHHQVTPVDLLKDGDKKSLKKESSKQSSVQKTRAKKRVNMHLEHKPSDEMDLMIQAVNEADLGWKADTCKYQKHNKLYGKQCDQELVLAQTKTINFDDNDDLQTQEDMEEQVKPFGDLNDPNFVKSLEKAQMFQKNYQDAQQIKDDEIPDSYDLRNLEGFDYTSDFRDQGHCGSCYTVSFTQVAESRLKLKYGKQPPLISPQMLMTCNYMNEGCDGGWPHFNVFLAQNGHMVSEECAPYLSKTKGDSCKNYEKCQPIAKINKSYFVGGSWGSTTEKKMMKEILRNGAINGDFQAPSMFSIYKEGIFREKGLIHLHESHQNRLLEMIGLSQTSSNANEVQSKQKKQHLSDSSLNDKGKIAWMDMNHSVVIVGWGVDKKSQQKYWIVRNSYGPKWGMNGDFLVARGNNDFGMEVEQIAFHPVLCGEDGAQCS